MICDCSFCDPQNWEDFDQTKRIGLPAFIRCESVKDPNGQKVVAVLKAFHSANSVKIDLADDKHFNCDTFQEAKNRILSSLSNTRTTRNSQNNKELVGKQKLRDDFGTSDWSISFVGIGSVPFDVLNLNRLTFGRHGTANIKNMKLRCHSSLPLVTNPRQIFQMSHTLALQQFITLKDVLPATVLPKRDGESSKKRASEQTTKAHKKHVDNESEYAEFFIPTKWTPKEARESWTSKDLKDFIVQNPSKAPQIVSILNILPQPDGIGNPTAIVLFCHPYTQEEIPVRIGLPLLYHTPKYCKTVNEAFTAWEQGHPPPYNFMHG